MLSKEPVEHGFRGVFVRVLRKLNQLDNVEELVSTGIVFNYRLLLVKKVRIVNIRKLASCKLAYLCQVSVTDLKTLLVLNT